MDIDDDRMQDLDDELERLDEKLEERRRKLDALTEKARRQLSQAIAGITLALDKEESISELREEMIQHLAAARALADAIVDTSEDLDTARSHSILASRIDDLLAGKE